MAAPKEVTWPIKEHTRAKHAILSKYLQAWLPIMTTYNDRVIFIDGFAGPGEYKEGDIGSPMIAIDAFLNHSLSQIHNKEVTFLFIEQDKKRCEHLNQLLSDRIKNHQFPFKGTYQVFHGNFDETMDGLLTKIEAQNLKLAPTFAFVDPFGFSHTPMKTIKRLMSHSRCEVLITFMYEEINRFLFTNYTNKISQYDALFGTSDWSKIAQSALTTTASERMIELHDLYQQQLNSAAGAKYVRSFCMKNKQNSTDYFLFFATNSLTGMDKMKQSMWVVDSSGSYNFSDYTNPYQQVLFHLGPDYSQMRKMLQQKFQGKSVSIEKIEEYLIVDTPFHTSGYKTNALKLMEKAQPAQIHVTNCPSNRRVGTYPSKDVLIHFL